VLKNYVLVAFQHLLKQKLYTLINVVGLAVGLACFILISLFVRHELAYDKGWANADRIYRVERDFLPTDISKAAYLPSMPPVGAAQLKEEFPEIEKTARIVRFGSTVRADDGTLHFERYGGQADNALFEIFDFRWLRGDPRTALAEPQSVVLTRSIAQKYFGDADPLGKTLTLEGAGPQKVTGVIEDLGDDTHLQFSMLSSLPPQPEIWTFNAFYTYVLLRAGADADTLRRGSDGFFERRFQQGSSKWTRFDVTAVRDIHLYSHKEAEMSTPGSASTVRTFAAIAVFILLLACINFMNLATARATQRAKEIGVRKVVGAERAQIVAQFLSESVLVAVIALLLAMAIVELALPPFNALLGKSIAFHYLDSPGPVAALAALTLVTGLLAGSYPAFYLAAFEPGRVLKGDAARGGGAAAFRRGLVVVQFAISIGLLIATGVVYEQTQFARNIDLGYDKDRIVIAESTAALSGLGKQWEALKREWLANPDITAVTASSYVPGQENTDAIAFVAEGAGPETGAGITELYVDYGFFETYGIEVLAGRTFAEQFGTDRASFSPDAPRAGTYVIGERLARRWGWTPQEAVGKSLQVAGAPQSRGPIVGVVKDLHFESIRSEIEPTVYMIAPEGMPFAPLRAASIKVSGRNLAATLDYIDKTWAKLNADQQIDRRFLDDDFEALYGAERRQAQMFTFFSALAIGIACLGLFGLASFTTERRTKEIGIRKTIGGGVADIVLMFCGEFGRLVLVANLVAWPIAYLLMQRWLASFAYRVDVSPWIFVGSAVAALAIACVTVGGVAARAASVKPVRALRYE
jgi:putative ABC transport system permease protein